MPVYGDAVEETSQSTGIGPLTLDGVPAGRARQTFVQAGLAGVQTAYRVEMGVLWENGLGTVTAGPPATLSRDSVLGSSSGGALVDWPPGIKSVICMFPAAEAEKIGTLEANLNALEATVAGLGLPQALGTADSPTFAGLTLTDQLQTDDNSEAGNTRLLIWDTDSGSRLRVSVGADGTGPGIAAGRALYLPPLVPPVPSLLTGLTSYWKLDEAAGTRNDSAGTNHLTDNNTVGSVAGKIGNAARLVAASSESLSRASNATLETGDINYSFVFWIRLTSTGALRCALSKNNGTGASEYILLVLSDGSLRWQVMDGAGLTVGSVDSAALGTGTWRLVEVYHSATANQVGIAVDGGAFVTATTTVAAGSNSSREFRLGCRGGAGDLFLDGDLDEVGFWKRTLNPRERADLWNGGLGRTYPFAGTGTGGDEEAVPVAGYYNVLDHGLAGDNLTLNDTPLATLLASTPDGSTYYFPNGIYKFASRIDLSAKQAWTFTGDGFRSGSHLGSVLRGPVNDYLLYYNGSNGMGTFLLERLDIDNSHATGRGLYLEYVNIGEIRHCQFTAGVGIFSGINVFTTHIHGCRFNGNYLTWPDNIGIVCASHCSIRASDITGYAEGVRASGPGLVLDCCRIEVNKIGVRLGMNSVGELYQLSGFSVAGLTMEANDTAVIVESATGGQISGLTIQGSVNSPSAQSKMGVLVRGANAIGFASIACSGSFSEAAIRIENASGSASWSNCLTQNTLSDRPTWDVRVGLSAATFINCDLPVALVGALARSSLQQHGRFETLARVNRLQPAAEGRNLAQVAVPVATDATFLDVVFTGDHGGGMAAPQSVVAETGGSLPAATYYYQATGVTARGEGGSTEVSVVVSGANNAVRVTFFGSTADGFRRRVYRGTQPGVYNGYYQLPLNSSAAFVDTGAPFDGFTSPPAVGVNNTSMVEPDANYGVWAAPSWNTGVWVSNKATTGFRMNFTAAAPAGALVDWLLFR